MTTTAGTPDAGDRETIEVRADREVYVMNESGSTVERITT